MNKRKLLSLALSLSMVAILAVGGTLAYFTDSDAKVNTFKVGNVDIQLNEDFGDNDPSTPEELNPTTGKNEDGTIKNAVTKKVTVENTGSKPAYVRVHIAIPQILDDGADTFDASSNLLHFNYAKDSVGEKKWDWSKTAGAVYEGDWNYYETQIDGITYNVYVVTHEEALAPGAETGEAIHQVYLDAEATNEDVAEATAVLGANWQILVLAEGTQIEGFANAYDALNTAFGDPTDAAYTSQIKWSNAEKQ